MIYTENKAFQDMINSPVRHIRARVELLGGSTQCDLLGCGDKLQSFTIERVGEGKFFGFGVCQKINVKLIDRERTLQPTTANKLEVVFSVGSDVIYTLPHFNITEVHRNENTNELSITAYDALYKAAEHTAAEITLSSYTIKELAVNCASLLGLNCRFEGFADEAALSLYYENGANLDGTEPLRTVLDAIAEATQSIYFVNSEWELVFKRLDKDGEAVLTIDKEKYFTLDSKTNRRLAVICHTTELGDNLTASITESGSTQYIRDNPLWEMREDVADLVNAALATVGGFTLNQFECEWRGNFLAEIGDKIALITKDNETVYSYLLDDTITYDGSYSQETRWSYTENDTETESNPATLGEALKQTYARVDKVNREIAIVASETEENANSISSILLNTESIALTVESIEQSTEEALAGVNDDISELTNRVNATMTSDAVVLEIQSQLSNGVDKVKTTTKGYTFDDDGLTVSQSGSEMKTQITEDGMLVFKNDKAVLTANNIGVNALNLHATTYLIIGNNSRFEDYGSNRTGCFWIGEV